MNSTYCNVIQWFEILYRVYLKYSIVTLNINFIRKSNT